MPYLILEPHKEKTANISGAVLLFNITAVASITAVLDVYIYSEAMAWVVIAVLMLPHCVLYTYGAIRGMHWLRERAVAVHRGFLFSSDSEENQLLSK